MKGVIKLRGVLRSIFVGIAIGGVIVGTLVCVMIVSILVCSIIVGFVVCGMIGESIVGFWHCGNRSFWVIGRVMVKKKRRLTMYPITEMEKKGKYRLGVSANGN